MIKNKARHRNAGLPSLRTRTPRVAGRRKFRLRAGLAATALAVTVTLSGCAPVAEPIPQGSQTSASNNSPAKSKTPAKKVPAKTLPRVSSCDQVREAFLTGSKAEVIAALKRLKADKSADGTAREYAGYWLGRDRSDPQMREMDETLIVSTCTL